jgi:hypothetical protein
LKHGRKKMKQIIILALLITAISFAQTPVDGTIAEGFISATEPSTQAELNRYALISANTLEDLETLLENGYPTPELKRIFSDESIPEEDRYWLDCRMRSAIAQLLHRFYDEHGNIIEVDADWIRPGEDYWQEIMMVNPLGEPQEIFPNGPSFHFPVESGSLYNLYGEEIGQLAAANEFARTSRNGSITIVHTGPRWRGGGGEMFFCFMYPDGSFSEIEFPDNTILSDRNMTMSQDGSISAWNIFKQRDYQDSQLLIFDNNENEIERYDIPYMTDWITISPDNRYVAMSLSQRGSCIINRSTGELMHLSTGGGRQPFFSENSQFCVIPEGYLDSYTPVVNLQDGSYTLISNIKATLEGRRDFSDASVCNDGSILLLNGQGYCNGRSIFASLDYEANSISPNGYFSFIGDVASGWQLGILNSFSILNLESIIKEDLVEVLGKLFGWIS